MVKLWCFCEIVKESPQEVGGCGFPRETGGFILPSYFVNFDMLRFHTTPLFPVELHITKHIFIDVQIPNINNIIGDSPAKYRIVGTSRYPIICERLTPERIVNRPMKVPVNAARRPTGPVRRATMNMSINITVSVSFE